MLADTLAEELFHGGYERLVSREWYVSPGDVGCLQASCERADVKAIWCGDLLLRDLAFPEAIGGLRLPGPGSCELRITPDDGSVTIESGPITLDQSAATREWTLARRS